MTAGYDPNIVVQGTGPAVVLVPGIDGTGRLFYRQTPGLARECRVATYALRSDTASMDRLVADLVHVIDTVAPEERCAIVVGESFGGALALSLALAHADRVAALVVLNSFAHFVPQYRLRVAIAALRATPWGAMRIVRAATASRLHSPHTHRREIRRFLELTAQASRLGYLNRLRILREYDVRERLRDMAVPALFLASDRDHLLPAVAYARDMAARVPGAVLRILAGHGHVCLIAPDVDLVDILREWQPGIFPARP
jgi:pimeloyl-ACP methyl ester carboxylesterase